jgi:hypothetical protein
MKLKSFLFLMVFTITALFNSGSLHAQTSTKARNLLNTWMIGTMTIQMHIPYDTTIAIYSRGVTSDTMGLAEMRMTFKPGGVFSGISKEGRATAGTWKLSEDEMKLMIRRNVGKNVDYSIIRAYTNYLELGLKKFGVRTVLKMIPE